MGVHILSCYAGIFDWQPSLSNVVVHQECIKLVYPGVWANSQNSFSVTKAFLAPEVLAGKDHTAQSVIYSAGGVVFSLFTGRIPYQAETGRCAVQRPLAPFMLFAAIGISFSGICCASQSIHTSVVISAGLVALQVHAIFDLAACGLLVVAPDIPFACLQRRRL